MSTDWGGGRQVGENLGLFFVKQKEDTLMPWSYIAIPTRKPETPLLKPHIRPPLYILLSQFQYFTVNSPWNPKQKTAGSNIEALSTSALAFFIGIVEHKLTTELIFHEIHLCADECHNGLVVNHHLDAFLIDHLVEFLDLLLPDVVHVVAQARTALLAEAYLYADLDQGTRTSELSFF